MANSKRKNESTTKLSFQSLSYRGMALCGRDRVNHLFNLGGCGSWRIMLHLHF